MRFNFPDRQEILVGAALRTLILGILRLWALRIPLSHAFAFPLKMGSDGIWLGMSLSNVISGLAAIGFLASGTWQRSVVELAQEETEETEPQGNQNPHSTAASK